MNLNYQELLPENFSDSSRVWIYQGSRLFEGSEIQRVQEMLEKFVAQWKSHGDPVKGYAKVLFGQFILLMADETATGVSGCSTDGSVRIIKEIEEQFKILLFDRRTMAFVIKDSIELIPFAELNHAVETRFIDANTMYFNNTVLTKKELLQRWIIPIKESWLATRINFGELTA